MKSVQLISSVLAMFFCVVSFAQELRSKEVKQPLFILDGKPINNNEFQNIKPETIESVTVLKDSAAKDLFDGQARNGIIIIKTKKLSKKELRKMKKKS